MSIKYDGLFRKLEENGITKTGLQKSLKISSTTLAKLSKNEYVSLKLIDEICNLLDCQPSDLMEYVPDDSTTSGLITKLRSEKRNKILDGLYSEIQIRSAMRVDPDSFFTYDRIREIYQSNQVNTENQAIDINEIIEIVNHFRCLDYILEHVREPLTIEMIRIIYRTLTINTFLNRKVKKIESEFIILEKKYSLESILIDYELIANKKIEDLSDLISKLVEMAPLYNKNQDIFALICFKETLRNNIDPILIQNDLNLEEKKDELLDYFKLKQLEFKKIMLK